MKIYSDKNKAVKTGVGETSSVSAERNFSADNSYYVSAKQPGKERENTDVYTHTSGDDEITSYEKYKKEKNTVSQESKTALEELLTNLKKSRSELYLFDEDAAAYRDMLIDKIKEMLQNEIKPLGISENKGILDAVMQSFEAERRAVESRVKEMKKTHTSLKIAIKTIDGTATEDEIRFLQKSSPAIYNIALSQIKSEHLNRDNPDTLQSKLANFL